MFPVTSETITGTEGVGGCFADGREAERDDMYANSLLVGGVKATTEVEKEANTAV